ncbi:nuclear fragile X mental retardation protein interacting protein 1 [Apophysomyces sp. BC1034]|nr:nuclear fragile X mental retardation protein interacting protein 1 [Apophysomyces sp. BC1034]
MAHNSNHTGQPHGENWGHLNSYDGHNYSQSQWQQYYQQSWPQYPPNASNDQTHQTATNTAYDQYTQQQPQNPQDQGASSIVYRLQQQTQQRQALGALAAASLTSALNPGRSYANHAAPANHIQSTQPQRPLVAYDDISQSMSSDPVQQSGTYCCNRWYKTTASLTSHEKQHVSCPDCKFTGIKSVVQQHEETEHGKPGKKRKPDGIVPPNAPKIDTPEDLQAWIEARKKNWPSQANVERKVEHENLVNRVLTAVMKKREAEERAARGELVPGAKRKHRQGKDTEVKKPRQENAASSIAPLGTIAAYESGSEGENAPDSDSDTSDGLMDLESNAISSKDPKSRGRIALPEENPTKPKRLCKYFARGNCGHGDSCRFSHEKVEKPKVKLTEVHLELLPKLLVKREPKNPEVTFRKRPNLLRMVSREDFYGNKT